MFRKPLRAGSRKPRRASAESERGEAAYGRAAGDDEREGADRDKQDEQPPEVDELQRMVAMHPDRRHWFPHSG